MLDIEQLIETRLEYGVGRVDEWLKEIIQADTQKEVFFILSETYFEDPCEKHLDSLCEKYQIAGIFDLSDIVTWKYDRMILIHAVSYNVDTIKIALFTPHVYEKLRGYRGAIDYIIRKEKPQSPSKRYRLHNNRRTFRKSCPRKQMSSDLSWRLGRSRTLYSRI